MNLFQKDRLGWEEITVLRFQVCQAHEKSSITLGLPQPFTSSIACCTTSLIKLVYEAQFRVFISKFRQSKNVEWRMTATWFLIKTCSSPLTCKHGLLLQKSVNGGVDVVFLLERALKFPVDIFRCFGSSACVLLLPSLLLSSIVKQFWLLVTFRSL